MTLVRDARQCASLNTNKRHGAVASQLWARWHYVPA